MKTREEVLHQVSVFNLTFEEQSSRMNYGFIGVLKKNGWVVARIFPSVFYMENKDFPLHAQHLELIKDIQTTFKELEGTLPEPIEISSKQYHELKESLFLELTSNGTIDSCDESYKAFDDALGSSNALKINWD